MRSIDFLQPRHPYAHDEGKGPGHVFMPGSLLTAVSRARIAGANIGSIADENLRPYAPQSDLVGIHLTGVPFIPRIRERMRQLGGDMQAIFGGQIINGLTKTVGTGPEKQVVERGEFDQLFGTGSVVGNVDADFANAIGIDARAMPSPAQTSLIPGYELLSDEDMKAYLSHEFPLYTSQGCKFSCDFCAAVRTKKDVFTGKMVQVAEEYRDAEILKKDFEYLVTNALAFQLPRIDMYLTNLDLFQTPERLKMFASIVQNAVHDAHKVDPQFSVGMRGLATVKSFMQLHQRRPDVLWDMVKAGLNTVGFGIDGWNEKTWKQIHKGHNSKKESIETMRLCREEYGIRPEVLMVFGHKKESQKAIDAAYNITEHMVHTYGATPRPHVAKDMSPGNNYWEGKDLVTRMRVEFLLTHPEYFQHFDYTCEASELTHLDPKQREDVNKNFRKMTELPGSTTHYIRAEVDEATRDENRGKFDR